MVKRRIITKILKEQEILTPEEEKYINAFVTWIGSQGWEYSKKNNYWYKRNKPEEITDWLALHDEYFYNILEMVSPT